MAVPGLLLADRYRLDTRIAAGGVGEVWQGTDLALERRVAVKVLRPEHTHDADGLARFRAEAHHAGSLSHPNIAHVYDFCAGRAPEPEFLVMEFVDGPSLARVLDNGPLGPAAVMNIIAQAAHGLAAAHRAGLVHRDIKPGNLLIGPEGQVKVTDFGIAQAAGAEPVTRTGMLIGTPAYLAPERGAGGAASPASDLYSLGIVAYQCLTGRIPFRGEPLAVVIAHMEQPMPPLPASVPPAVAALVTELTSKDPGRRPASAGEVAVRAEQLRVGLGGPAPRRSPAGAGAAGLLPAAPEAATAIRGPSLEWSPASSPGPRAATPQAAAGWPQEDQLPDPAPPGRGPGPDPVRDPDPDPDPEDRHALTWLPARAALALSAVGAAGLLGWTLLTPGAAQTPHHALTRPTVSQHARPHTSLARQQGHSRPGTPGQISPAAAVAPDRVTGQASQPAQAAASPGPAVPSAATATPSASPSGVASSSPAPSDSPTPTAPSTSPPASPTPTPSGSSATGGASVPSSPGAGPAGTIGSLLAAGIPSPFRPSGTAGN